MKNPTVLTNGGGECSLFLYNLSGRYRIANVICMENNYTICDFYPKRRGSKMNMIKTATSVERHLYNLAGC